MLMPLKFHKMPKYYCKLCLTEENICILSIFQMMNTTLFILFKL